MKKHKIKPRNLFLLISLLAVAAAFLIYTVCVGGTYTFTESLGKSPVEQSRIHAVSSDENVVRIDSVEQVADDSVYSIAVTVKGVAAGNCVVTLMYPLSETGETCVRETAFRVLPFGIVYDQTIDSFTGLQVFFPLFLLVMLLLIFVLSLDFAEKIRRGDFSYSMVGIGGILLFFLLNFIISVTEPHTWHFQNVSTKDILALIMSSGNRFVMFSEIPVILLSLALAISNIWLVVREGFRPQNLLGVVIAVIIAGGMILIRLSNNYNEIESDALYYVAMVMNISAAFLLSYFECMFLSTMFCAIASACYVPPYPLDYLMILGCAIQKDGTPTPILRGRVQRAFDFEREQYEKVGKHAVFVPSGGQGSDEVISEAESMKRCLMEMGVPEDRILKEDHSVNTYQNMAFSKKVIEQNAGELEKVKIGFSTTNYHVFRGYTLAEKLNMKVKGLSAKTKLYFFPNAFVREFVGLLWEKKWRHLLFITLFFVFLLILYLIIRY